MRTTPGVMLGAVLGGVIGAALVFVVLERPARWFTRDPGAGAGATVASTVAPSAESAMRSRPPAPAAAVRPADADRVANRTPARPTTPVYDQSPADAHAIYRCRAGRRTTYSNTPCSDGTIVDDSSAVTGYDTRPSAAMQRMIAEGRDRPAEPQPASRVAAVGGPAASAPYDDCAAMRRQVVDIDAQMRMPNTLRVLDEFRQIRQDVRTRMAREHC